MAIVLETISDSKAAQADLLRLRGSVENIQKSVDKTTQKFAEFAKAAALIGTAAIAVSNFAKLSDGLTNLTTKIKLATESQEEFEFALKQIRKTALETRAEISSVTDLYNKISKAGRDVGASQTTVAKFANTVAKAISMSGAGAAQANAAILQLGQGLASGKLAGDELRSVLENAPALAFAIADGLKVSVGELRKLGEAGALTTETVFKALLSQRDKLEKDFAKVAVTYSAAFTNIKNSLSILAAEISKTFFKSSGSIAIFINDVALKIGKFAENFEYNFVRIKMFLRGFVLDTAILLNSFKNSLNIDLDNFFPKLQEVLPKIKEFVRSVESAFAWLYDRVIGNSWVPDLVLETIDWFKKLLKEPVEIAKEFTSRIDKTFGKMSGIAAGLFLLAKYRTSLLGITGLITSLGFGLSLLMDKKPEAFEGITQSLSKFIDKFKKDFTLPEKVREATKNVRLLRAERIKELQSVSASNASELSSEFRSTEFLAANASIESSVKLTEKLSNFVKRIKQDFVLPEKIREAIKNTKILNEKQAKAIEERPLLKKVFDVIPEGARVPLIAAFTVIFTSALVGAFNNEVARKFAFFFGTSVGSLFALRAVDTQVISKTLSDLAYGFVKIIGAGLNAVFDGNILGEKFFGLPILIATLAKIAFLFSAGREFLANAIRAGVAAPTNLAQAVIQRGQEQFLRSQAEKTETKLRQQGLNQNILQQGQRDLQQNVRTLGNMLAADRIQQAQMSGRPLNAQEIVRARMEAQQQAAKSVAMGQLQGIGPGTTAQINAQFRTIQDQQKIVEEQRKAFNALNNTRLELERQANVIRDARIAATDALKQGAIGAGASLGGALFGVAGLQLGISIAKGMEGASSWQKIGVIISSAILAQVIGTTIGTALVTTIVSGIPFIAGLIASRLSSIFATLIPSIVLRSFLTTFVVGAALFAGVFYTAYKTWELLPDVWKQKLKDSAESVIPGLKKDEKLAEVLTKVGVGPGQPGSGLGIPALQAIQTLMILTIQNTEKLLQISEVQPKKEDLTDLTGSLKELKTSTDKLNENLKPATRPGWQIQKPEDLVRKATGGWIRGPGTGTSDSIPAMLSNGEFVVNARDAAKNWDILTAINSGVRVNKFKNGTIKDTRKGIEALQSNEPATASFTKSLDESVKNIDSIHLKNLKYYKEKPLKYDFVPDPSMAVFDWRVPRILSRNPIRANLNDSQVLPKFAAILSYATTLHEQGHAWSLGTKIENLINTKQKSKVDDLLEVWEKAYRFKSTFPFVESKAISSLSETVIPEEKIATDFANKHSILKGEDQVKFSTFLSMFFGTYTDFLKYSLKEVLQKDLMKLIYDKKGVPGGNLTFQGKVKWLADTIQKDYNNNLKILENYLQKQPTQEIDELVKTVDASKYTLKAVPDHPDNKFAFYDQKSGARSASFAKYILDSLIEELKKDASSPVKKASGGWIKGPGTATSDSIPALLSNGEFVVNARDAAKNWDILAAINSGMSVKRFAGGSALSPEFSSTEFLATSLSERTRLEIAKDQAQKVIEAAKDQSAKLKEEAAKQAQKVIDSAKNLNQASAKIANSAESLKKGAEDLSNTAARQAAEQAAKLREQAVKQGQRAGEAAREAIDTGKNALDAARVPVTTAVADVQAKANAAFANQGTQTSAEIKEFANNITKTFLGFLGTLPDKIKEYLPGIEEGFNKLLKSFGINVEEAPKTFAERLKKDKSGQSTLKAMEIALKDAGFPGVTAKELEKLAQPRDKGGDPEAFQRIVESLDKYYEAQKQLKSGNLPKLLEGLGRQQVEDAGSNLQKALKSADAFKDIADKFKVATTPLVFGEQFEIFKKIFPKIELTQNAFEELPDVSRQFITRIAFDLNKSREKLDALQVGTKEGGPNFSAQVSEKVKELNQNINDSEIVIREYLKNWMTSFDALKPLIEKSGISIDKLDFTVLSDDLQDQVKILLEKAAEAVNIFNRADVSRDARRKAAENFKNAQKSIKNIFEPSKELETVTAFSVFQTGLKEAGVQIEDELLARIRLFDEATTDAILRGIIELQFTKGLPPEEAAIAQAAIRKRITDDIANSLPKKADDLKAQTDEASKAFASSIQESITSNLADVLKGKKTGKEAWRGILDTFTSSVIDTFIKGLMSPLTGEKGLTTTFQRLGAGLFGTGESLLTKGSNFLFGTPASKTEDGNQIPIKGFLDKFTEGFKSIDFKGLWATFTDSFKNIDFSGMWDLFKKGFDFVLKFLGFAQGGYVSGPGTPTSDSIPAMLSNGEFVINAKATKDNIKLLTAINNGSFRKFAEGGLVSTAMIATPAIADIGKPASISNQNQQVININITGDVSRQTRAQIYEMLPSIAEGVNMHNREKGYKR